MEKLTEDLNTSGMKIINTSKKVMMPLTKIQERQYETCKYCHICKKKFCNYESDKKKYIKYRKVRDHDHYTGQFRGAAHSERNLRYSTTKDIPVISHNGTNYDYHFIINGLAKRFNAKDFNCLGENMEKYITIKVPIVKTKDNGELVTYKLSSNLVVIYLFFNNNTI